MGQRKTRARGWPAGRTWCIKCRNVTFCAVFPTVSVSLYCLFFYLLMSSFPLISEHMWPWFPLSPGLIGLNCTSSLPSSSRYSGSSAPSQSTQKNKTNSKTSSSKSQMNFKENLQKPTQELGRLEEVKWTARRRPRERVERTREFTNEEEGKRKCCPSL